MSAATRLRSAPVAAAISILFVLLIAGLAAANTILYPTIVNKAGTTATTLSTTTAATAAAFVDVNGNGVADSCEQNVVADPAKAAAEAAAVDANHDGTISVREAAHSDRIGGKNCNHGGYVSSVASGTETAGDEDANETDDTQKDATCVPVAPPARDPALDGHKNSHGKWVSSVAQSDAIGGKNCNHGGAVSDAAKADNAARKAARDAAKAARKAGGGTD